MTPGFPEDAANRALLSEVHPPGWENPTPKGRYNLVVIGAGTAGLVTAAACAGLGGKVALVERHWMGGDCLNTGCVPSKALIHAARAAKLSGRRDFAEAMKGLREVRAAIAPADGAARFRDLGVDVFFGEASFDVGEHVRVGEQRLQFARAVIATGARAFVPPIPGLESAPYLTNETVFDLQELPARMLIVGGGPIGCELAQSFARFGSQVTLLDLSDRVLVNDDPDASAIVQRSLEDDGVRVLLGATLARVESDGVASIDVAGSRQRVAYDALLLATGRAPNVEGLGLDVVGVEYDKSGVVVDDRLRTSNRRIFAAGDCCTHFKFTHAADAMARIVVRNALFFGRAKASKLVIPWATYTDPEVAHVGLTPRSAEMRGVAIDTYERSLSEVDRAITDDVTEGFLRVHTARGGDRIVGATVVGPHAGELIAQFAHAMTTGQGLGRLAATIHPYPTLSLGIKQLGDQYSRTRLTPWVARFFRRILEWRR